MTIDLDTGTYTDPADFDVLAELFGDDPIEPVARRPWITRPGVYDLSELDYHSDPVVGGSLSSSGARLLANDCPARFAHQREHGRPDTKAFDEGRAAHTLVLGEGAPLAVYDGDAWRTNTAKAFRADARAAGETPLLAKDAAKVYDMAHALRRHEVAGPLLSRAGRAEQSFVARDPETGVLCRVRVDWMPEVGPGGRVVLVDYKSTASADPAAFAKSMANYGYHQQGAFYSDAITWLGLDNGRPPVFVLIAQEKEPPYLVTVARIKPSTLEWGRVLNRRARDVYRHCTATGVWPGYETGPAGIVELELPGWQVSQYENALQAGRFDPIGEDTP